MNILVPLVLFVMPMSIDMSSFLFVIAGLSTVSCAGLLLSRPLPLPGLPRRMQTKRRRASDDYARRWHDINSLSRRLRFLNRRPQILPRMRASGATISALAMTRTRPRDADIRSFPEPAAAPAMTQ
jgi:hypothetical protein